MSRPGQNRAPQARLINACWLLTSAALVSLVAAGAGDEVVTEYVELADARDVDALVAWIGAHLLGIAH
jgi:hypothetical protein